MSSPLGHDLNGFDLIYALTQRTLNNQIALLSALSLLPGRWSYAGPHGLTGIDAELDTPVVDMATGDASARKVDLTFPVASGSMTYGAIGFDSSNVPTVVPKRVDVTGWYLKLSVNLSLADIAQQALQEHRKVPNAVKRQLQHFTSDMYDIRHLFLNFEDADLVDNFEFSPPDDAQSQEMTDPTVLNQVRSNVQAMINGLKGSDNPFIFGYAVTNRTTNEPNADFLPTGTTYSVYPEPKIIDRSALNFLSVTGGAKVPGGNHGLFTHNWITADNVQGAFVIAQELLMAKILPPIAAQLGATLGEFQQTGSSLHVAKGNDQGGTISVTVSPVVHQPRITAAFVSTFRQDVHDRAGSKIGYTDGQMSWTTTLTFTFDKTNNLAIEVSNSPVKQEHHNHKNALGKFESVLSVFGDVVLKIFSFGLAPNVFENLSSGDWHNKINADFSNITGNIKTRLVLPAGSQFFFKDATMSQEGHLIMTTTIKN